MTAPLNAEFQAVRDKKKYWVVSSKDMQRSQESIRAHEQNIIQGVTESWRTEWIVGEGVKGGGIKSGGKDFK